jgi:hypothetical protein
MHKRCKEYYISCFLLSLQLISEISTLAFASLIHFCSVVADLRILSKIMFESLMQVCRHGFIMMVRVVDSYLDITTTPRNLGLLWNQSFH